MKANCKHIGVELRSSSVVACEYSRLSPPTAEGCATTGCLPLCVCHRDRSEVCTGPQMIPEPQMISKLGPVSRKPGKLFGPVQPLQNLEPCDHRAVLFTYSKDEGRFPSDDTRSFRRIHFSVFRYR